VLVKLRIGDLFGTGRNDWQWYDRKARTRLTSDRAKAERIYRRAIDRFPNVAGLRNNYGAFLSDDARHDEAEAQFRAALEIDPADANALGNLASLLYEVHRDRDGAEVLFERSIAAAPDDAVLLNNFANFLTDARRADDRANELYEQAHRVDERTSLMLGNYASFLFKRRADTERADHLYTRALVLDPHNPYLLAGYAMLVDRVHHDHDRAEELFRQALRSDPDNPRVLGHYADFLTAAHKDDASAQARYREALALEPSSPKHLGNYGWLLLHRLGDKDGAQEHFERAYEADPDDAIALGNLGRFYIFERNEPDRGEPLLLRALEISPHEGAFLSWHGSLLERRGDLAGARRRFEEAVAVDPDNPVRLGNLGTLLLAQGDPSGTDLLDRCEAHPGFRGDDVTGLSLGVAFARLSAVDPSSDESSGALASVRADLVAGMRSPTSYLRPNIERARLDGRSAEHLELLERLDAVITGDAPLESLDGLPGW